MFNIIDIGIDKEWLSHDTIDFMQGPIDTVQEMVQCRLCDGWDVTHYYTDNDFEWFCGLVEEHFILKHPDEHTVYCLAK